MQSVSYRLQEFSVSKSKNKNIQQKITFNILSLRKNSYSKFVASFEWQHPLQDISRQKVFFLDFLLMSAKTVGKRISENIILLNKTFSTIYPRQASTDLKLSTQTYSQKLSFLVLLKTYVKTSFMGSFYLISYRFAFSSLFNFHLYMKFLFGIVFGEYHFPLFRKIFNKLVILNFVFVKNSNFGTSAQASFKDHFIK